MAIYPYLTPYKTKSLNRHIYWRRLKKSLRGPRGFARPKHSPIF